MIEVLCFVAGILAGVTACLLWQYPRLGYRNPGPPGKRPKPKPRQKTQEPIFKCAGCGTAPDQLTTYDYSGDMYCSQDCFDKYVGEHSSDQDGG